MLPTLGQFRWHLLLQCQIAPVGYRKSAAMSSLVQKWWSKESVFFTWWWIHCGTVLGAFGIILVPFLGHLRSWGSVLGSPGLSWVHFGIHIRLCHHFWPNPSQIPVHFGTHFETIMRMLTYLEPFLWCPILSCIFGGILEGAMWTKCCKKMPELMFLCFQKWRFWDHF